VGDGEFHPIRGLKGRWLITFLFGLVHGLGSRAYCATWALPPTLLALPCAGVVQSRRGGGADCDCGVLLVNLAGQKVGAVSEARGATVFSVRGGPGSYWLVKRLWFN